MKLSTSTKSPEADTDFEPPLQTHLTRALSLNTYLIPCQRNHPPRRQEPPKMVASYKECLKNHAAKIGGLALDGCGEFMPAPSASSLEPTSLKCAACGCHRNFHRRDLYNHTTVNYLPPPPPQPLPWNSSPSPGPTSSGQSPDPSSPASPTPQHSIYPSAPHMLLALSTGHSAPLPENHHHHHNHHNYHQSSSHPGEVNPYGRKRSRTKFSEEQREKMLVFAEKFGWKMQRGGHNEKMLEEFCNEVGVERNVFKVWMHNNKQRREKVSNGHNNTTTNNIDCNNNLDGNANEVYNNNFDGFQIESKVHVDGSTDGSSPSS